MNNTNNIPAEAQEETAERVSRRRLELLASSLHDRDRDILGALQESRFMTSKQISRQHFEPDHANPAAAQRATNRAMHRLQGHGLVTTIYRRVGGARGGSSGFVWALTPQGARFMGLGEDSQTRKRSFEPSPRFVEHTLAVSELHVQLLGINGVALTDIQFEPACWRSYNGKDGARQQLKPDLYAVTSDGEYEDSWFFEIDLATEAPSRVVTKCEQYQDYYRSGAEQAKHGIFPKVVWIIPGAKRRATLQERIAGNTALTDKGLFAFVLPDELEALVRKGAGV
jgi:hypothetical protein